MKLIKSTILSLAAITAAATVAVPAVMAGDTDIYTRTKVHSLIGDSQPDNVLLTQRIGVTKNGFWAEAGPGVRFVDSTESAMITAEVGYADKVSENVSIYLAAEPRFNIDNDNWDVRLQGSAVIKLN